MSDDTRTLGQCMHCGCVEVIWPDWVNIHGDGFDLCLPGDDPRAVVCARCGAAELVMLDSDGLLVVPVCGHKPCKDAVRAHLRALLDRDDDLPTILTGNPTERDRCAPDCPGWFGSHSGEHGYRIERCDSCDRFASDEEAVLHVERLAGWAESTIGDVSGWSDERRERWERAQHPSP